MPRFRITKDVGYDNYFEVGIFDDKEYEMVVDCKEEYAESICALLNDKFGKELEDKEELPTDHSGCIHLADGCEGLFSNMKGKCPDKKTNDIGTCPNCGGSMLGDGYTSVLRCENADVPFDVEPDAPPYYCSKDGIN